MSDGLARAARRHPWIAPHLPRDFGLSRLPEGHTASSAILSETQLASEPHADVDRLLGWPPRGAHPRTPAGSHRGHHRRRQWLLEELSGGQAPDDLTVLDSRQAMGPPTLRACGQRRDAQVARTVRYAGPGSAQARHAMTALIGHWLSVRRGRERNLAQRSRVSVAGHLAASSSRPVARALRGSAQILGLSRLARPGP